MRDAGLEWVFSLFTSPDRALAIAGDLAEERDARGSIWFWLHVVRVTLALWRNAAIDAPIRVLALTLAGCTLLTGSAVTGAASIRLFPQVPGSPVNWMWLWFFWWGGALWTGLSLVAIAPQRGMWACATLAAAGVALTTGLAVTAAWHGVLSADLLLFCSTGLLSAAPLLAGGAIARRRTIGG